MPKYTATPNLRTLNRYLTYTTDADFDYANPSYQPMLLNMDLDWAALEDEKAFCEGFDTLTTKFELVNHYDNLLYLTLHTYDQVWQGIQIAYDAYVPKKRARELAHLILMLKDTKKGKLDVINFKSLTQTAKVNDTHLNDWISTTLLKALEEKAFKIGDFGPSILEMLTDKADPFDTEPLNLEKIKKYATIRLVNPKNRIRKGMVSIALVVHSYLQGETTMKSETNSSLSDVQLKFIFELLELLQMVKSIEIDSEPKDYLRTAIQNFLSK